MPPIGWRRELEDARAVMGSVEIRSGAGLVLVGPPGLFPGALREHKRRYAAMQALFADPRAVTRLRWYWADLGLGGDPRAASDTELRGLFEQALRHGRLVALHVPRGSSGALPIALVPAVAKPKVGAAPVVRPPVSGWSRSERIEEALRRSTLYVGPEFRALIDRLLSAETVATMVAFCIAIVLAQAGGVSAAALDAALLAIAYGCAGLAGIQALYEFIAAAVTASGARTEQDLDAAARRFARAFTKLGEAFIAWLLARLQARGSGGAREPEQAPARSEPRSTRRGADEARADTRPLAVPKGSGTLFRGDSRPPDVIFEEGFAPRGTATDLKDYVLKNEASIYVGTSTSAEQAAVFAEQQGGGFLYKIDRTSLKELDVNQAFPDNPLSHEQEIAIIGGVPRSAIQSAQEVLPDGRLGDIIPNPYYKPSP